MKTEQRYVWLSEEGHFNGIVTDLEKLFRVEGYNESDKLYELGPEVKLEMSVKVIPKTPVYRSWENKE